MVRCVVRPVLFPGGAVGGLVGRHVAQLTRVHQTVDVVQDMVPTTTTITPELQVACVLKGVVHFQAGEGGAEGVWVRGEGV